MDWSLIMAMPLMLLAGFMGDAVSRDEGNGGTEGGRDANAEDAGEGEDQISTGEEDDLIRSYASDDLGEAEAGDELLEGGAGEDLLDVAEGDEAVIVAEEGTAEDDGDAEEARIVAGDGALLAKGGALTCGDGVGGLEGDDALEGDAGDEALEGADGDDLLDADGSDATEEGGVEDQLLAVAGADTAADDAGGESDASEPESYTARIAAFDPVEDVLFLEDPEADDGDIGMELVTDGVVVTLAQQVVLLEGLKELPDAGSVMVARPS